MARPRVPALTRAGPGLATGKTGDRAGHSQAGCGSACEPAAGRLFRLDTGTLSTLGTEHGQQVMRMWNAAPAR